MFVPRGISVPSACTAIVALLLLLQHTSALQLRQLRGAAPRVDTCMTIMAMWEGDGPESTVSPGWRYTRDECTAMGRTLAISLNNLVRANRAIFGTMSRSFSSRGCILSDAKGYMGAQVCGSFTAESHLDSLVTVLQTADSQGQDPATSLLRLARSGSLCQVPDYNFYLTNLVASSKPWGFFETVPSPFFFTTSVACTRAPLK